jgi:hypothetical protein
LPVALFRVAIALAAHSAQAKIEAFASQNGNEANCYFE